MVRQISARGPVAVVVALVLTLVALPLILLVVTAVAALGLVLILLRLAYGAAALLGAPFRLPRRGPDEGRRNVRVIDRSGGA